MSPETPAPAVRHAPDVSTEVAAGAAVLPGARVTFARVLRAEWLKLWTLRSTWWTVGLTVLLMAGFALLMANTLGAAVDSPDMQQTMGADPRFAAPNGVVAVTFGYGFAQLTVAVLGVLSITGEYSTGMIRSTFSTEPRRLRVLGAKLAVLVVTTATMTVVGLAAAWLASASTLSAHDLGLDLSDGEQVRALGGTVLYLVAVAALSLGIGALLRSTPGAIAAAVALLLVLPITFQIVAGSPGADWAADVYRYLPTVAGERVIASGPTPDELLTPWTGYAVLVGYTTFALAAAAVAMRRRDA